MSAKELPPKKPGLLRWAGLCAVALLLGAAIVVATTRWVRHAMVDDKAWAALALMSGPLPPAQGSNGFIDLYLADYHVPAGRRQAAISAELGYLQAMSAAPGDARLPTRLLGAAGMPERAKLEEPAGCPTFSCLRHVLANTAQTRATLVAEAERLAGAERAFAADHLRNPFPYGAHQPVLNYKLARLVLAAAALDAVEGRIPRAYSRTCSMLASMRRLSRNPDSMIDKMIGVTFARASAEQLLALRRAYPVPALPADCAEATAPVQPDEPQVCGAMRGEFRAYAAISEAFEANLSRGAGTWLLSRLLFDQRVLDAWLAESLAPACASENLDRASRGLPPDYAGLAEIHRRPSGCYGQPLACAVAAKLHPKTNDDHARRVIDETMRLRLLLAGQRIADGALTPAQAVAQSDLEGYEVRFDPRAELATMKLLAGRGEASANVDYSGLWPSVGGD